MAKDRTPTPKNTAAKVRWLSDDTCCICRERGKDIQIHHINENPTDHRIENLAILCLNCHNQTQKSGGFARQYDPEFVTLYRDEWRDEVRLRKDEARKIAVERQVGENQRALALPPKIETSKEIDLVYPEFDMNMHLMHPHDWLKKYSYRDRLKSFITINHKHRRRCAQLWIYSSERYLEMSDEDFRIDTVHTQDDQLYLAREIYLSRVSSKDFAFYLKEALVKCSVLFGCIDFWGKDSQADLLLNEPSFDERIAQDRWGHNTYIVTWDDFVDDKRLIDVLSLIPNLFNMVSAEYRTTEYGIPVIQDLLDNEKMHFNPNSLMHIPCSKIPEDEPHKTVEEFGYYEYPEDETKPLDEHKVVALEAIRLLVLHFLEKRYPKVEKHHEEGEQ